MNITELSELMDNVTFCLVMAFFLVLSVAVLKLFWDVGYLMGIDEIRRESDEDD